MTFCVLILKLFENQSKIQVHIHGYLHILPLQICASDSPIHARDDRLHSALLPDAQAARNEKRGHMAYRRVACRARCATAFDALRRHAAVERQPARYSHFSPDFFINILCSYVRLVLVNVLLVRTLAV